MALPESESEGEMTTAAPTQTPTSIWQDVMGAGVRERFIDAGAIRRRLDRAGIPMFAHIGNAGIDLGIFRHDERGLAVPG